MPCPTWRRNRRAGAETTNPQKCTTAKMGECTLKINADNHFQIHSPYSSSSQACRHFSLGTALCIGGLAMLGAQRLMQAAGALWPLFGETRIGAQAEPVE